MPYRRQMTLWAAPDKPIAAFRYDRGKLFGIYPDGQEREFLHVHLQKRQMDFERGLENEDSFLIFPSGFAHDHEITREEITESITPSPEYEAEWEKKYRTRGTVNKLLRRAGIFLHDTPRGKISLLKYLFDAVRHHGW